MQQTFKFHNPIVIKNEALNLFALQKFVLFFSDERTSLKMIYYNK